MSVRLVLTCYSEPGRIVRPSKVEYMHAESVSQVKQPGHKNVHLNKL